MLGSLNKTKKKMPHTPQTNTKLTVPIFGHLSIATCKSLFKQTFCYLLLERVKVGTEMIELNMALSVSKSKFLFSPCKQTETENIISNGIICRVVTAEITAI